MAEATGIRCGDKFTYGRWDDKAEDGRYTDSCTKPAGHSDDLHKGSTADWRHCERDGETFDTYVRWA